jgi:hypothetical protein
MIQSKKYHRTIFVDQDGVILENVTYNRKIKSTKYHAVIGHSLLCTGDTEEEVKEWVFDNPAKIAICASMEYWHSLDEFKAFQKKLKEEKND